MATDVAASTVRISVIGVQGRADLSVPVWCELSEVAAAYARSVGAGERPSLSTTSGRRLDPHRSIEDAGLESGQLVVALGQERPAGTMPGGAVEVRRGTGGWKGPLVPSAVAAAAVGAGALAGLSGGRAASLCGVVLLLAALVAAVRPAAAAGPARRGVTAAAPALGAGVGLAFALSPGPGRVLLGVAVGALGAVVTAAVARAFHADEDAVEALDVWLVTSAVVAVLAGVVLLVGASLTTVLALAFGIAVATARLLPFLVLDVPDEALLDLDRLAVTAWSVRGGRRWSSRRGATVRAEGVRRVVRRGQRLMSAGSVAVGLVACAAGGLLVVDPGEGLGRVGALVMVGLGGCTLALLGRSMRSRTSRLALRGSAVFLLAVLGAVLIGQVTGPAWWLVFAGCGGLGLIVVLVAVAVGRGWRSVRWARMADLAETVTVVLVVAAIPLACGIFEGVRQLAS